MRFLSSFLFGALLAPTTGDPTGAPPAAVPPPTTPAPAPPPAAPQGPGDDIEIRMPKKAFDQRREEERAGARSALFKQYGVKDQAELDAKLKKLADLEAEKLTAEERTAKELEELRGKAKGAEASTAALSRAVTALEATLSAEQKAAIDEQQPATVEERLRLIEFARKLGGNVAPAAPPAPPKPPAPANLGPPPNPPPPGGKSKYQEWKDLEAVNPLGASIFYAANKAAINASRPQGA